MLTDGRRLVMWRADDDMSMGEEQQRQVLNASVRTIPVSTITDHILTTEFDVLNDGTRQRRAGTDGAVTSVRQGAVALHVGRSIQRGEEGACQVAEGADQR